MKETEGKIQEQHSRRRKMMIDSAFKIFEDRSSTVDL